MSLKGKAYIVGAYEHPTRKAPDKSLAQLHAEVAKGALDDAGLSKGDVDAYFCASGGARPRMWCRRWGGGVARKEPVGRLESNAA